MAFSQDDLEMKLFGINLGKKEKSIVDTQGNPINSDEQISRRNFLKGSVGALGSVALKTTGIGTAASFLVNGEAEASYSLREELKRRYINNPVPPGATPKLCQDQLLSESYIYLMTKGFGYDRMRTVLLHENISTDSIKIDHQSWECEPLMYVALNTYRWKSRNKLDFNTSQKAYMKKYFFHQHELMEGINEFYNWHVIKKKKGINPEIERKLLNNIFQAAEEYPGRDISKTNEYLAGDLNTRLKLVTELSERYSKMKWSQSDKEHRNIDINKGELGPLNNWYRLLSAQWGAFFLVNEYNYTKGKYEFARKIYSILEEPLQLGTTRLRGPPFYFDFTGKTKV
jgi:hypothetical protein